VYWASGTMLPSPSDVSHSTSAGTVLGIGSSSRSGHPSEGGMAVEMFCLIPSRLHISRENCEAKRGSLSEIDFLGEAVVGEDVGGIQFLPLLLRRPSRCTA